MNRSRDPSDRRTRSGVRVVVAALAMLGVVWASPRAHAREVDQFTDRLFQLQRLGDASGVIDRELQAILSRLVDELNDQRPESARDIDRIVRDAFQSSRFDYISQLVTPFESWLRDDAPVDLFAVSDGGIYGGSVDYDDMRMGWYLKPAPVIRVGSLLIGIDKIGHFVSQGWFYFVRERAIRRADPSASNAEVDRRIRHYGHDLESNFLGFGGTGVYSYADLAANWQGLMFFRSLFGGPNPHIAIANGRYMLARPFHIVDYATDAWDEVNNPSRPQSDRFFDKVAHRLRARVCAEYRVAPTVFLNASGQSQDPRDYVWEGVTDHSFACKRRFAIADICR